MEDELLYRRIKYFALVCYWVQPHSGQSQSSEYRQHIIPRGYFPTIEEAREEAKKKNLGKEIPEEKFHPRIRLGNFRNHDPRKSLLRGHQITEVFIFTADGKTGFVQGGDWTPVQIPGTKENTWEKDEDNPYLDTFQY